MKSKSRGFPVSRRAPLRALIALLCAAGVATAAESEPRLTLPKIERATLANGMRVVAAEYDELPLFEVLLVMGSGAAHDPPGKEGLASLVAGLLRRGTEERDAAAFAEAVEFLGGSIEATIAHERTVLTAQFLSKDAREGLGLLAEMVQAPAFRRGEVRREREDVLAALEARYEDPSTVATLCYDAFLYGTHPYGRAVDGRAAAVEKIGRADVKAFYERHYRANNALAVVVGDLPAATLVSHVRDAFASWSPGSPPPPVLPEPRKNRERRVLVVDRPSATQAQIRMGNVSISRLDPQYVVGQVANTVLGGGFTSRLVETLRVERGLTYGAWSAFSPRRASGDFEVGTFSKVETAAETVRVALEELGRFRTQPPSASELAKAQSYLRGQFPLTLQGPDALGSRLAEVEWYGLGSEELSEFRARVGRVTAAEVETFVERAIPGPESVVVVVVGPAALIAPELESLGPVQIVTARECETLGGSALTVARR